MAVLRMASTAESYQVLGQHKLQFDLRKEIDRVFPASVNLRVALLASMATHIANGHAAYAKLGN